MNTETLQFAVIAKGAVFAIEEKSTQEGPKVFYFGAGWDNPNGPVDLDIVATLKTNGVVVAQSDLIYFGNRNAPGVALSEDNTTGEGEGDDEDIVIDTSKVPAHVTSIEIGLAAYGQGVDLNNAPNAHFRVCDGNEESSPQMADVTVGAAAVGDTVLHAFTLNRTDAGWTLENVATFHAKGNGSNAIQGFASL